MAHAALERAWSVARPAFGGWVTINAEAVVGAIERAGYDFVGFDCQHGAINETDAAVMIRRLGGASAATIVRVSENSMTLIGRVLDAGADAIIVPLVNNAEEAARAVAACRYPPRGARSFGPSRPGLPLIPADLEARASCFVMIETAAGIANVDAICAVPGVAGVVIGPADLSISMGLDPHAAFSSDQIHGAVELVRAACERNQIVLGIFSISGADAARWAKRGCRLIVVGGDLAALTRTLVGELAVANGHEPAAPTGRYQSGN
jgi:4-hydroxy-2-oxoheptanedioate aldolase